jgi:protein-L-isoaspartate(D-aspartate) O-methyltransferase
MKSRPSFPARLDTTGKPGDVQRGTAARAPATLVRSAPHRSHAFEATRKSMVAKLVALGLADRQVRGAMEAVERHRFVDTALEGQAYEDTSLPIGLGQTISKPGVVARMIELLLNGRTDRLGSGPGDRDRLRVPGRGFEPGRDRGLQHRASARSA